MTQQFLPEDVVESLCADFRSGISQIFGDNLLFAFIGGGIAKGYADYNHDIDMVVVEKVRNSSQESAYKEFFYKLHEKHGFKTEEFPTIDISFGIAADRVKFDNMMAILANLRVTPAIEKFETFEALVWGDMMSGKIAGAVGDLECLEGFQNICRRHKETWRTQIYQNCITRETLSVESPLIEEMDITRLFEYFVTYLKTKSGSPSEEYKVAVVTNRDGEADQIVQRVRAAGNVVYPVTLSDMACLPNCDIAIIASCIASAPEQAKTLMRALGDKIVINLADGFLDTYRLNIALKEDDERALLPSALINIRGMNSYNDSVEYEHTFSMAHFPPSRTVRTLSYRVVKDVLGIPLTEVRLHRSMLHAAMDCAGAIDIAVGAINMDAAHILMPHKAVCSAQRIVSDCNRVAKEILGHGFDRPDALPVDISVDFSSIQAAISVLVPIENIAQQIGIETADLSGLIDQAIKRYYVDFRSDKQNLPFAKLLAGGTEGGSTKLILTDQAEALLTEQTSAALRMRHHATKRAIGIHFDL